MARRVVGWSLGLIALAVAVGVPGAGGRSLATTTIVVQVLGDGRVTAGGGQITCGQGSTTCFFSTSGTGSMTLTATPSSGWTFAGWSGSDDCSGAASTCSVTFNGGTDPQEEIANFTTSPPSTSRLTVNVTGDSQDKGGNVSGGDIDCDPGEDDCTWDVATGSTVTVVETPDDGYVFSGWGGDCSGTARSCTVSMGTDRNVNATFAQAATTFTLSVAVTGNGTVTGGGISCTSAGGSGCSQSETANSSVTLTATPGAGAGFTGWGGACAGTATTCVVTMNAAKSVTAAFTGAGGGTEATVPLTVTVTGNGTVTGGGIDCGSGAARCSVAVAASTSVTLTATPGAGATFTGWGGACSGSTRTCTLTMSAARSVAATFSGGTPAAGTATLTLLVSGKGTVTATGGACSSTGPPRTCTQPYDAGTNVRLTAVPAPGARFVTWGGACAGTVTACTVEVTGSIRITATFSGAVAAGAALASLGRPVVRRAAGGFEVTLRFRAGQRGVVRVRALRAGRVETTLGFTVGAGPGTVGPLRLKKPGYYAFELRLGGRALEWHACLGRCGAAARVGPFTVVREPATVLRAGQAWSVTLRFRSNRPAGVALRILRAGKPIRDVLRAPPAGNVRVGPFVLSPATYTFRLTATDAYGRARRLTWFALLPA
jgi:uncharacterized repeat protein (TIGR02543 family)